MTPGRRSALLLVACVALVAGQSARPPEWRPAAAGGAPQHTAADPRPPPPDGGNGPAAGGRNDEEELTTATLRLSAPEPAQLTAAPTAASAPAPGPTPGQEPVRDGSPTSGGPAGRAGTEQPVVTVVPVDGAGQSHGAGTGDHVEYELDVSTEAPAGVRERPGAPARHQVQMGSESKPGSEPESGPKPSKPPPVTPTSGIIYWPAYGATTRRAVPGAFIYRRRPSLASDRIHFPTLTPNRGLNRFDQQLSSHRGRVHFPTQTPLAGHGRRWPPVRPAIVPVRTAQPVQPTRPRLPATAGFSG